MPKVVQALINIAFAKLRRLGDFKLHETKIPLGNSECCLQMFEIWGRVWLWETSNPGTTNVCTKSARYFLKKQ